MVWPATLSGDEAWWVAMGLIGVCASAYDIWRAEKEMRFHWRPDEPAERGIARTSMLKAVLLGTYSVLALLAGIIVALLPPGQQTEGARLLSRVVVYLLITGQALVVGVILTRDFERVFLKRFIWAVRERRPDDPSPHEVPTPPFQTPPEQA